MPVEGGYHCKEAEAVRSDFGTNPECGLSSSQVAQNRSKYGENKLPEPKRVSYARLFLKQLIDFMVLLLIAAAGLSAAFGDFKAMAVLLIVVVVNICIGFSQEAKAERALTSLLSSRASAQHADVLRDGHVVQVNASELVVGDIVNIDEGDQVPADLRLVNASHLDVDESSLTGESVPVDKDTKIIKKPNAPIGDRKNMAYMMTMVTKGRGNGVVVAVGVETEVGKSSKAMQSREKQRKTNLQQKLSQLGKWLVLVSVVLCSAVTVIGILRGHSLFKMVETGVSLAVSVIPEGLVAVTTVTMALGVQRMAKRQAIVRQLPAVEVLGAVSVIASDKTGTLTEGKMMASQLWVMDKTFYVSGSGITPEGAIFEDDKFQTKVQNLSDVEEVILACSLCNNSSLYREGEEEPQMSAPAENKGLSGLKRENFRRNSQGNIVIPQDTNDIRNSTDQLPRPPSPSPTSPSIQAQTTQSATPSHTKQPSSNTSHTKQPSSNTSHTKQPSSNTSHTKQPSSNTSHTKQPNSGNASHAKQSSICIASHTKQASSVSRTRQPSTSSASHVKSSSHSRKASTISSQASRKQSAQSEGKADYGTFRRKSVTSSKAKPEVWKTVGTPTEIALNVLSMKVGMSKDSLFDKGWEFIRDVPFDSERKRMSVVYNAPDGNGCIVFVKGAVEHLLPMCTHFKVEHLAGAISQSEKDRIADQASNMAATGMRVLAVASRHFAGEDVSYNDENEEAADAAIEKNLTFLGLVGLIDPPRTQVIPAIRECQKAGVTVIMITGDHPTTAKSIANQLELFPPNCDQEAYLVTGSRVDEMSDEELAALNPFPCVFARVSPEVKLRVVHALQYQKKIIAFVGDGVNDAAAIKNAHVGVAMGCTGTDVSQQCADIILSDDNFEHIVVALEEGRRVYDNIFKFTIYLLSCNSAEIFTMLVGVILNTPSPPFTAIQILFANIIADVPPSLSLGVEPVEKGVMKRKPRNPEAHFFGLEPAIVVTLQGMTMAALSSAAFLSALYLEKYELLHAQCLVFSMIVMIQLFHAFLSRSFRKSLFTTGFLGNWWLIAAFFFSSLCLVGSMYIPKLNTALDMEPLTLIDWCKIVGAVVVHTVVVEVMKVVLRVIDKKRKLKERGSQRKKKKEKKYSKSGSQYELISEV